ncbi:thiamine ABC transporter ATP-binding protein [Celeribacter litoreus]|uniref:thiamine ABC transporter ATP-binding protein n=1 Tax=Celeribacter litoreus TaxID=2876714 RepID=UPI001CCBA0B8|nr:ATP-binding cassette domain-containing protein [Celeribacter litoreus]MCA0041961.1 ATP-binding cassette domain-containing protein [Celeribacter litoreus]
MLELRNIRLTQKEAGADFTLSVSAAVPNGSRIAVIGPSGAGKSTLMSLIGGFARSDEGQLIWRGEDLTNSTPAKRPIAHLFQDHNLFAHMTAAQNVGLGIRPNLRLSSEETARVCEALAAVGLKGFERRKPAELSGGQQSRVALARVLVQEKPLVLLDEPFSALGPAMRREMIALAKDVGTRLGATMLMVTHDIADVEAFADQVIWIEDGRCDPPRDWSEIKANPPSGLSAYIGT